MVVRPKSSIAVLTNVGFRILVAKGSVFINSENLTR